MKRESVDIVEPAGSRFFYGYVVALAGFVVWMVGFGVRNPFGILVGVFEYL